MAAGRVQDKKFTAETRCMKFSISRDALLKPLSLVAGVVERRQTLPVLSNVLITLEADRLSLTGTDTEVELAARITLPEPGESGEITTGGTNELPMRNQYRSWVRHMTETM